MRGSPQAAALTRYRNSHNTDAGPTRFAAEEALDERLLLFDKIVTMCFLCRGLLHGLYGLRCHRKPPESAWNYTEPRRTQCAEARRALSNRAVAGELSRAGCILILFTRTARPQIA